jgi:hypothetical protein
MHIAAMFVGDLWNTMARLRAAVVIAAALALAPVAGGFSSAFASRRCEAPAFVPTAAGGWARAALAPRLRPTRPRAPGSGARMFFSTPDVGNLLSAPQDQRFFNPVWFPYFARPTHVEEVAPAQGTQRWTSFLSTRLGSAPPSTGIWMFEQVWHARRGVHLLGRRACACLCTAGITRAPALAVALA